MFTYWDTSCVLKLYCPESDSELYFEKIEFASAPPVSSALLTTELYFAFHQKHLRGEAGGRKVEELMRQFTSDLKKGRINLFPLGGDVQSEAERICRFCYERPKPIGLRTLDGLHLATAILSSSSAVVTTDSRMTLALAALGLRAG